MNRTLNLPAGDDRALLFGGTEAEFERILNEKKLLLYSIVYSVSGDSDADDIVLP